jgi:selenide, water dikinase
VFRIGEAGDPDAEAILSTIDFFTPVVESPFDFGRIAAANALSDIYAMGGEALFALNVAGFPVAKLPLAVLEEILRGGAEIAHEAGMPILGGHTTDFDVPMYGLAVTGRIRASAIRRNVGAHPGDALVLTKSIGTGVLTAGLRASALKGKALLGFGTKSRLLSPDEEDAALRSMVRLNRSAARAADGLAISSCTDVTGYGLLGHLGEVLRGSGVAAELTMSTIPLLAGARRLAAQGFVPEGTRKNLDAFRPGLAIGAGISEVDLLLLADAQTSGGLLFTLPPDQAVGLVHRARDGGDMPSTIIGRIMVGEPGRIGIES